MPSLVAVLARLERFDSYPADDALAAALSAVCSWTAAPDADPAAAAAAQAADNAALVLFDQFRGTAQGQAAWTALTDWARQRLDNWHNFKVEGLQSAWHADPSAQDLQGMLRTVVIDLRQGVADNPDLVADAHLLQALAASGHKFAWGQAIKELREDGLPFPADDRLLARHAGICVKAFRYLVG